MKVSRDIPVTSRNIGIHADPADIFPKLIDNEIIEAERRFVEENPHADVLREVFHQAAIEYGRVDFALVDGRSQVYEINTNPLVMGETDNFGDQRSEAREASANALIDAFVAVDYEGPRSRVAITRPPQRYPWENRGLAYSMATLVATILLNPSKAPSIYSRLVRLTERVAGRKWFPRSGA